GGRVALVPRDVAAQVPPSAALGEVEELLVDLPDLALHRGAVRGVGGHGGARGGRLKGSLTLQAPAGAGNPGPGRNPPRATATPHLHTIPTGPRRRWSRS